MSISRQELLGHCLKCRMYLRFGLNVADARLELKRAQRLLRKMRKRENEHVNEGKTSIR